jgi:hypothetical protein
LPGARKRRLAGYEDVDDAGRLCRDPATRWVAGDRAITGSAASASQMGRFETKWPSRLDNLAALADLPGQWIDQVHERRTPKMIVLDMDSSESPTYGEQEGSLYNGHFACTCHHPLFVFNQFGDVERCGLRPGNGHSADGWRAVPEPVIGRYRGSVKRLYFRGDAAFASPEMYDFLEAEGIGYTIRLPANSILQSRIGYLLRRRSATARGATPLRQFQLSGTELEQAAPRCGQIRVASGRAVPARRLHHYQPGAAGRAGRRFLQRARHSRAMNQRGKGRDQMDSAVVPYLRRQCRAAAAPCAGLQPRHFMRTLAMPNAAEPWSLTSLREKLIKIGAKVVSHGRYVTFQMAEVAVPRQMFIDILSLIAGLRAPPAPA